MSVADAAPPRAAPESAGGLEYGALASENLVEASREYVKIPPRNGEDGYSPTQNRRITIPMPTQQAYWDVGSSHLTAVFTHTPGGASWSCFPAIGVSACIKTITLKVAGGGEPIVIQDYNKILALLAGFYSEDWKSKVGRRFGYGSLSQRQMDAATPKKRQFDLSVVGLLAQRFHVPLFATALEWIIELENPMLATVSDYASGTTPTYSLTGVNWGVELITGTANLDALVLGSLQANIPVTFSVRNLQLIPATLLTSESVTQKNFSRYVEQMTAYMAYFQLQEMQTDWTADIYDMFVNPGCQDAQLQIGAVYFPPQAIVYESGVASATQRGAVEGQLAIERAMFRGSHLLSSDYDGDAYDANPPTGGPPAVPTSGSRFCMIIPLGQARDADRNAGINTAVPPQPSILRYRGIAALSKVLDLNQIVMNTGSIVLGTNRMEFFE